MLTTLTRDALHELLPHSGDMCLLDRVLACDVERITVSSRVGSVGEHPLAKDGCLSPLLVPEYAAQAAALHLTGQDSRFGAGRSVFLAAVKALNWRGRGLLTGAELVLDVRSISVSDSGVIYSFSAQTTEGAFEIQGRISLMVAAEAPPFTTG